MITNCLRSGWWETVGPISGDGRGFNVSSSFAPLRHQRMPLQKASKTVDPLVRVGTQRRGVVGHWKASSGYGCMAFSCRGITPHPARTVRREGELPDARPRRATMGRVPLALGFYPDTAKYSHRPPSEVVRLHRCFPLALSHPHSR